jgi:hypothetical protein
MIVKALIEYLKLNGWNMSKHFPDTTSWYKNGKQINIFDKNYVTVYHQESFIDKVEIMIILKNKNGFIKYFIEE